MSDDSRQAPSLFTHIDVTTASTTGATTAEGRRPVGMLLSQMVAAQNRQNELLEQLIQQMSAGAASAFGRVGAVEAGQSATGPAMPSGGRDAGPDPDSVPGERDGRNRDQRGLHDGRRVHAQRVRRSLRPASGPSERRAAGPLAVEQRAGVESGS